MALLSAPSFAADNDSDITTKVTTNLKTSTANAGAASNILIETNGSVVVTSTTPAVTIDTSNFLTNKGTISNTATTGSVGVQLNATGITGGFDNIGTIDLSGAGQNKIGIQITDPNALGGIFNGSSAFPSPNTAITRPTAIYFEAGSTMTIVGDGSTGILLQSTAALNGDILINGTITMNPTSTTSATGGNLVGVDLLGNMTGNFDIGTGGSLSVFGNGAHGVIVGGVLTGSFINLGTIQALGTTTPSTTTANAEAGSAVIVENSINGGFYNGGPTASSPNIGSGSIGESGSSPAINFIIGPTTTAKVVIGVTGSTTDPSVANYAFVNRGLIAGTTLSPNLSVAGIQFVGTSSFGMKLDGDGFFNSGSISTTSTSNADALAPITVEGAIIGGFSSMSKLVNSNESNSGLISASASGTNQALVTAIDIQPNGSLTEIDNSGSISATANTTDTTISQLSAFAIRDQTNGGVLTKVVNSGQITAVATTLDDGLQVGSAIDLTNSSLNFTLQNSGRVSGAIALGSGSDTISNIGSGGPNSPAVIAGDIDFGGGSDTLIIGDASNPGQVTGALQEALGGRIDVTVNPGSSLVITNDGTDTNNGLDLTTNVPVHNMTVQTGGTLGLTLAQVFNVNAPATFAGPIIQSTGNVVLDSGLKDFSVTFGSFIGATNNSASSQFVLIDTPSNALTIGSVGEISNDIVGPTSVPFLFSASVCTFNVAGSSLPCAGTEPINGTDSELVLNLTPKTATDLGLTGYAAKMFPIVNLALANDNPLGAAVINAGSGITDATQGNALYQKIYSDFAPDVTGSQRALAVALSDQSTGAVGARQRALRMYAGQDGDATMWGQEFTERLNVGNQIAAAGYNDSGFGFALGMDGGSPSSGRYGVAFTFYSGDTSEKEPRDSKTTSEWYMLTGYSDWRGKGFFFDSNLSIGYGSIDGKRVFDFGGVDRTAEGKRSAAMASGGMTAGVAMTSGGTVIMPQISVDGLVMRQEKYTESNNGATSTSAVDGFDLAVAQEYDQSLRSFAGLDVRQDMNFGDFFLQPEARLGYRYDFLDAAQKLKAQFVCSTVGAGAGGCAPTDFSITGPDPAKGNLVAGGSISTTTGAWSIGLNYDYVRGLGNGGGKDAVTQSGTITLVGRI
ncbi:MAG TPA: autotransporter domain-containing protein [Rhizomicrobium sp.]|jgi:hypothetical protein